MTDADPAPVVRALLDAQRSGQTGALEAHAGELFTVVYFHAGRAVFAEEGTLGETLGRLLVQQGRLTQDAYAAVIDYMTEKLVDNEQMRFGEAAVALGFLTGEQVNDALADQVKRKIARVLRARGVVATFREAPDAIDGLARYPCTIEPILLAVCRDDLGHERTEAVVVPYATQRLVAPAPAELAERFGAAPQELRVLRALDGTRTLADVCTDHGQGVAFPVLAALLLAGELEEAHADARATAHEPPPEARPAPRRAVPAPPAPPPEAAEDPEQLRRRAMAAAASLVRGRLPLPDVAPTKRSEAPGDPRRARVEAEQAFHRGQRELREGHPERALSHLRRATALYPEAGEYRLVLAFAELRLAADDVARLHAKQVLVAEVRASLERDPALAFAHYAAGHLALLDDESERAERCFRRARQLDPAEIDAERQLRLLKLRKRP